MAASKATPTIRINGSAVLDFGNGIRIRIDVDPRGAKGAPKPEATAPARGRKPSPATAALVKALHEDLVSGRQRLKADYLSVLRKAGHTGSDASANIIINRESKRVFRKPLPRARRNGSGTSPGTRGRPAANHTVVLRERLAADQQANSLREASFYVKWLIDQPDVQLGLKAARTIVYRELRAVSKR
jgi:hypothetical protein